MILFWGSKGYQKDLGHTQTAIECGHCNNVDTWEIVETGRKFKMCIRDRAIFGSTLFMLDLHLISSIKIVATFAFS